MVEWLMHCVYALICQTCALVLPLILVVLFTLLRLSAGLIQTRDPQRKTTA